MKLVVLPYSESYSEETKCTEVKINQFFCNQEYYQSNSIRKCVRIKNIFSVFFICQHFYRIYLLSAHFFWLQMTERSIMLDNLFKRQVAK